METPKRPGESRHGQGGPAHPPRSLEVTRPTVVLGTPQSKSEVTRPVIRPDQLVTEGMKARRREIERKKRAARLEKLIREEENAAIKSRMTRFILWTAVIVLAAWGYFKVQEAHSNQWPIMDVWIVMSIAVFAGIGWILWYQNKSDL